MTQVTLLECTLRDGSYAVNFQFTPQESMLMALALERAGVTMVEVGHGLGLNAMNMGKGEAAASDEEYMEVMSGNLKSASWGMFCIPGIAEKKHLLTAARYGMGFVRVGTNVTEHEQAEPFINLARSKGLFTAANLMKSYAVSKEELVLKAKDMEKYGAQALYLVDSAGTMLPNEVGDYVTALREAIDIPIGFHGHDNLSLALANSLAAIDAGAQYIDSTLQGLGRGGGNPATELLVAVLQKRGDITTEYNLNLLIDISQEIVSPLQNEQRFSSLSIIAGFAGFHSGFLESVLKVAAEFDVDARDLIVRLCEIDKVNAPHDLLINLAMQLSGKDSLQQSVEVADVGGWIHGAPYSLRYGLQPLQRLIDDIKAVAKSPKRGVLNVVCSQQHSDEPYVFPLVQDQGPYAIGSVEIGDLDTAVRVFEFVNGKIPSLLVDDDNINSIPQPLSELASQYAPAAQVYSYSDSSTWASSIVDVLIEKIGSIRGKRFLLYGNGDVMQHVGWSLSQYGSVVCYICSCDDDVTFWTVNSELECETKESRVSDLGFPISALICFAKDQRQLRQEQVARWLPELIVDGSIGGISSNAIAEAAKRNIPVIRPDMRASIAARLHALQGVRKLVGNDMGRKRIEDLFIVGGGYLGRKGDIVVDSVGTPTRVLGIASGDGYVDYDISNKNKRNVERVWKYILNDRFFLKRNAK